MDFQEILFCPRVRIPPTTLKGQTLYGRSLRSLPSRVLHLRCRGFLLAIQVDPPHTTIKFPDRKEQQAETRLAE
jgi:hypothetical protein